METLETEKNFSSAWRYYWNKPSFRIQFLLFVLLLGSFMFLFPYFFDFIEARRGYPLNDPILNLLPAKDVSTIVFTFLYFAIISWLVIAIRNPKVLLAGIQTYCMVTIFRLFTITLFPLEPPVNYIPLREPFVQLFTHGRIISRDLFFSGHMTTILFCYYNTSRGVFKYLFFVFAIIIAVLLMVQRVHYTIDILAAPLFTWLCFLLSKKVLLAKI